MDGGDLHGEISDIALQLLLLKNVLKHVIIYLSLSLQGYIHISSIIISLLNSSMPPSSLDSSPASLVKSALS